MHQEKEYAELRENTNVVKSDSSELSVDISYKQISYTADKFKVVLEFPKEEMNKGDIDKLSKEIQSILSVELQEQIKKIS